MRSVRQSEMQDGVGPAGRVERLAAGDAKSQTGVETPCLRVLLVDVDPPGAAVFDGMSYQPAPQPFAASGGGDEEHFDARSTKPHEGREILRSVANDPQFRGRERPCAYHFPVEAHVAGSKKIVRGTDGGFPQADEGVRLPPVRVVRRSIILKAVGSELACRRLRRKARSGPGQSACGCAAFYNSVTGSLRRLKLRDRAAANGVS